MKVKLRNIIFDEFTIEKKDGSIIDISKTKESIDTKDIVEGWGYICKNCSDNYNFKTHSVDDGIEGAICYINDCESKEGVIEFSLSDSDISDLQFIE